MTAIDRAFARARRNDEAGFTEWLRLVELPLRRSLARFARVVDVEAVVQETLLRMLIVARDPERELTGDNASLRFAIGVARNVAHEEIRKLGHEDLVDPADLEQVEVDPEPPSDHALRRAILACIERLPSRPRSALRQRLLMGHESPDREIAASLRMRLNTFFQNITRARRLLAECLAGRGIRLPEIPR